MKTHLLFVGLICCLTSPAYANNISHYASVMPQPSVKTYAASRNSENGSPRIHSITVDGDLNDTRNAVVDRAIYKAAKTTLMHNYDWFRVVVQNVDRGEAYSEGRRPLQSGYQSVPVRECGPSICTTTYKKTHNGQARATQSNHISEYFSAHLKIEMGFGHIAEADNVYKVFDARGGKPKFK
ncbi:MAG: CC0125/CC1285 family lipoprotein [Maricaulaceae bacterium]